MPTETGARRAVATLAALAIAASGCSPEAGRVEVKGTVTLDGRPLETGVVNLLPQADGPAASAKVAGGAFAIPAADGPKPGPYLVEIHSIRATGKAPTKPIDPDYAAEETVDLIPPKYHRDTRLKIDVKAGGPQTFDFPLESATVKGGRSKGSR